MSTRKHGSFRYSKEDKEFIYYKTIYLFHTLEDNKTQNIFEEIKKDFNGLGISKISSCLDKYLDSRRNLRQLALDSKTEAKFIFICREDKRLKCETNATASKPQCEKGTESMQYREEERRGEKR